MIFKVPFLILLIAMTAPGQAQYSPNPPDSIHPETLSRSEIRKQLLQMEDLPHIYTLARQSRRYNIWSIAWYSIGGVFTLGGVGALVAMNQPYEGSGWSDRTAYALLPVHAGLNFLIGGTAILAGISQGKKSRLRLQEAMEAYRLSGTNQP